MILSDHLVCSGLPLALPVPPEDATPTAAAMVRWLHALALHLDEPLSTPLLTQPYLLADMEEKPLSAAACFQALLAQPNNPDSTKVSVESQSVLK